MKVVNLIAVSLLLALAAGCGAYRWKSDVPAGMRTVSVPVFRNEGSLTGLGGEVARQVLREIGREGTFRVADEGGAAVEVQGSVSSSTPKVVAYERKTGARNREHALSARTTFLAGDDVLTGARDAEGRLAEDLARQIVDDLLAYRWKGDVEACFLMSGAYDLLVFVKGDSLQDVAQFVAQDLSTIDGVLSTATHFMLKTYKAAGVLDVQGEDGRLAVTP